MPGAGCPTTTAAPRATTVFFDEGGEAAPAPGASSGEQAEGQGSNNTKVDEKKVSAEPLPEPAFVRARAEGRDGERLTGGTVVPLSSRRRRVLGAIACVAAAAVVAFSLGLSLFAGPLFTYTDAAARQMLSSDAYVRAVLPEEAP